MFVLNKYREDSKVIKMLWILLEYTRDYKLLVMGIFNRKLSLSFALFSFLFVIGKIYLCYY